MKAILKVSLLISIAGSLAGISPAFAQAPAPTAIDRVAAADAVGTGAPAASDAPTPQAAIIVTARKTSERLIDVPASISVLNQKAIESQQVSRLSDLSRIVPSLTIFPGVVEYLPYVTMRGLATTQGSEPSVSLIVDGFQAPGGAFFNQSLDEAQSIEVLRGPQGALYGRGAIAGAIIINTKHPTNDLAGDARVEVGNGGTYKGNATVSGPIVRDKLLLKVSGVFDRFGGLVENIGYHGKSDAKRTGSVRGELLFEPTDRTQVDLRADYLNYRGVGVDWAVVTRAQLNDYSILPNYNVKPYETRWMRNVGLKIEHRFDFGTVTSVTQNSVNHNTNGGDGEFSPTPLVVFAQKVNQAAWNQDLRFTSPTSRTFNYLFGLFYQHRTNVQPLLVTGDPAGPLAGRTLLNSNQYDLSDAYAAYAQGKLSLAGGWDLTAAVRYDIEDRLQLDRNNPSASRITAAFRALQPQASLTKHFSDNVTGYLSYGRGFRSGGFNAYADVAIPRPLAPYPVLRTFPKETADNFEVGFKANVLDRTLFVSASAYYTKVKDLQYFLFFPPDANGKGIARDVVSIPDTRIKGFELEANWTPIRELRFNGAFVLTDGHIKGSLYDGNSIANTPRDTINLGAEYELALASDSSLTFRADYQRQGRIFWDIQNTYRYNGVDLLSGRVTLRKGKVELSAVGLNLLNRKYPAAFNPNGFANGISLRRMIRPRTYGVEARVRF